MASRYDAFDNGSPTEDRLKYQSSNVGRSAHDFSCNHAGNLLLGMFGVIDCFDVVPNEDLQMSVGLSVEFRNPTNRPLLNGFRAFVHCRYNRLIDLWEGARNFIDKGRSGNIDLIRPNLIYTAISETDSCKCSANTPMSLLNMLGLPPSHMHKSSDMPPLRSFQSAAEHYNLNTSSKNIIDYDEIGNVSDFFPADCAFAYQRNWRDFYSNKNLLQSNKYWFPDNEDHFILSYSCENACAILYENEDFSDSASQNDSLFENITGKLPEFNSASEWEDFIPVTPEPNNPLSIAPDDTYPYLYAPNLSGIKFVQFRGDRFTTACPFPDLIRGDIPVLSMNQSNLLDLQVKEGATWQSRPIVAESYGDNAPEYYRNLIVGTASGTSENLDVRIVNPLSSVTMSDLYTLETLTAFKRKLGMTNGDYSESIKSQFGVDPRVHDRKGTYVGGFFMDLGTQTVIQTSESSSSPLGTKAGNGYGVMRGEIGSFHVPDFGWIQTYLFVVPDVYYTQGKPRQYSKSLSTELYFPLFNNLPAQSIRNDELFISGTKATDEAPFGYEDRYAEYKGRTNRVSGFMGLSHSVAVYDSAKVMARRFSSTPALNSLFVTMVPENVDMEVFSVVDEPPLDFNASISVRRVFPGPYMAIEGSLSSPALN